MGTYVIVTKYYRMLCERVSFWAVCHSDQVLFLLGTVLLYLGLSEAADAQWGAQHSRYYTACNRLLALIEGPFGALVTTAAGIGAIVMSALGGFKMAWGLVVVAVGAFILRAYITLFFGGCFDAGLGL